MTPTTLLRGPKLWREIGHRVRAARDATNMPPTAFALHVRISKQMLNLIERGERGVRIETLYRIAKATDRPITDFLPSAEDV